MFAPAPPDPVDVGTTLGVDLGGRVLDLAVGLAPVAVPFILALTVITWALHKFGLAGQVGAFARDVRGVREYGTGFHDWEAGEKPLCSNAKALREFQAGNIDQEAYAFIRNENASYRRYWRDRAKGTI